MTTTTFQRLPPLLIPSHQESVFNIYVFLGGGGNKSIQSIEVPMVISDKIGFITINITRGKKEYLMMIKGSIKKENLIVLNVYVPNSSYKVRKEKK